MGSSIIVNELAHELTRRISITELISSYVRTKRVGKDYYAICPFHLDTKPSMRIREERGVFFCFGCNQGGDAIKFVMKMHNISFREALLYLAERYAPDLIAEMKTNDYSLRKEILRVNFHAMKILRKHLKKEKRALDYLKDRGITSVLIDEFGLGFAPDDPEIVPKQLVKEGFSEDILAKGTGFVKRDVNKLLLIFRNRVVIPITGSKDEILGFGARAIDNETSPKYINSSESPVFRKRESFFGISQAKDQMRKEGTCIIVEGFFDVLSMHKAGFKNTISCLGTSITPLHILFIKKLCDDIIVMFDGDSAGRKALLRNLETFLRSGVVPYIVPTPYGYDPDRLVMESKDIEGIIRCMKDGLVFIMERLKRESKGDSARMRKALKDVLKLIGLLEGSSEQEIYIKEAERIFGVSSKTLSNDVPRSPRMQEASDSQFESSEFEILKFASIYPEALSRVFDEHIIDFMSDGRIKEAFLSLRSGDIWSDKVSDIITRARAESLDINDWENLFNATVKTLKWRRLKKQRSVTKFK